MLSPTATTVHPPRNDRAPAMTSVVATIIIVVVLAAMSFGTFVVLGGLNRTPPVTCEPLNSPACSGFENLHDVAVLAPFKAAAQGSPVTFTASLPQGESASSYTFNFGDGTTQKTTSDIATHNYTSQGTYLVYVQADVNNVLHDNVGALDLLKVTQSAQLGNAGTSAALTASIVANTSSPNVATGVTAVLSPGQSVTLSASYSAQPTNPAFSTLPPKFLTSTGGTMTLIANTSTTAKASFQFSSTGSNTVTFVGESTNATAKVFSNYTWTVYVAASGIHGGIFGSQAPQSPHPGTIVSYELAPGGAASEDPAIDYETVGAEPITNVYQTLIAYNGTDVGPAASNYLPEAATCVPGSPQCKTLYSGNSLQSGNNYTFVIQPNATFFDPTTGAHWPMFPTDVEFSIARDLGFSTLPFATARPGWIVAQALLGPGNESWDYIHQAYNNTPQNILGSMTINESGVCPSVAQAPRGCITFNADGNKQSWPDFLEFVADPLGAGIVPCGWFSAKSQGAGIPYWTRGNVSPSGDQPCTVPGGGMGALPSQIPAEGWDQWEELGSGSFNGQYLGNVQWGMVGSGPYYMESYDVGSSYELKANQYYYQNPDCTWTGCQPKHGQYASTVSVTWETSEVPGEEALKYGAADSATIPPTSIGILLQLIQEGKVNAIQSPTLSIFFQAFDMNFNIAGAQHYSTNPISTPNDFFTYLGMREFFSRAYPYTTIENSIWTKDGIQFEFDEGGAIPQFMGNYYPTNITWPNSNPCSSASDPACPAYWWSQMTTQGSAYYDAEATHCTSANPCALPIFASTGNPAQDQINSIWIASLAQQSGGAIKAFPVDINFVDLVQNSQSAVAGDNPMPVYSLGWAPDYPDPTDYIVPMYYPNSTYTASGAVATQLEQNQFDQGCPYTVQQYAQWGKLAVTTGIPQSCQGIAYRSMLKAFDAAASDPNLAQRQVIYTEGEQIAYGLCLYLYAGQANSIGYPASWVDVNSLDTNPMATGAFYLLTGNGVQFPGST